MDQTKTHHGLEQTYRLLALCARPQGHPAFYERLAEEIQKFGHWNLLPDQAELHGMAPLLWHHLKLGDIEIPSQTTRILQGLYLRHRYFNQFHTDSLLTLTDLLGKADIQPIVLKGPALAHTCYPHPALRPMSDLDLLLTTEQIVPALELMQANGYTVQMPKEGLPPKELVAESPEREQLRTHIELHHYHPAVRSRWSFLTDTEFEGFIHTPQQVKVNTGSFLTPNVMDHFHYLWRHLLRHFFVAPAERPAQLKWVADIIGVAEHYADEIDWDKLKRRHPDLIRRLDFFYSLTPISPKHKEIIPIKEIEPPNGVYQYPSGWPQQTLKSSARTGLWQSLRRTFSLPSDWWLKFYYGIEDRSIFWYGRFVHRFKLIQMILWRAIKVLKR